MLNNLENNLHSHVHLRHNLRHIYDPKTPSRFYAPTDMSDARANVASSALSSEDADEDDMSDREIPESHGPELIPPIAISSVPSTGSVIAAIWPFCAVVFFTFAQTISVFPAVTELIESTLPERSLWTERYFSLVT